MNTIENVTKLSTVQCFSRFGSGRITHSLSCSLTLSKNINIPGDTGCGSRSFSIMHNCFIFQKMNTFYTCSQKCKFVWQRCSRGHDGGHDK
uniref:Uncharacterized protein n=1 Tax=Anguilla anguilla TaxID=7936 RepID=A0A0E9X3B1_ANGAN